MSSTVLGIMGLGKRIREARGEMTQRELADLLGVDPMTVSRWERDVVDVSNRKVRRIAEATGKPLSFFYEGAAA
jgi:transcriptional regulator with XRE-family HTH domain